MKVCDRCKEQMQGGQKIKISGEEFELCEECSEQAMNYIKFSKKPKSKIQKMFGG